MRTILFLTLLAIGLGRGATVPVDPVLTTNGGVLASPANFFTANAAGINAVVAGSTTIAWNHVTGTPTTLSGYGITDPIVLTSGSYANPSWITQLAASKLTGALPSISGASLTSLTWSQIGSTPTTISGYGITDPIVLTSGSYSNPAWITGLAWSKLSSTPTTISGYGITDPIVLTSGSYVNPSWITQLAASKLSGALPSISGASLTSLTWSQIGSTPTTISGYGITDPIVLTSGSYANPAWITSLAWSKVSSTPTTISGYGITDAYTKTLADARYFQIGNNLSEGTATTLRTNLGLGTLATQSGTFSGASSGTNTGDQTITLTGDATGSGTGSFAVTVGKIGGMAVSLAGALTTSGANALTFTTTGTTNVTLPPSGTLAILGANTFTGIETLSAAGAASAPVLVMSGALYTAGNGTTNMPLILLGSGTAVTTWSTAGTYTGVDAASGFAGNFIDFHINGGASLFKLTSAGSISLAGGIAPGAAINFGANTGIEQIILADGGGTSRYGMAVTGADFQCFIPFGSSSLYSWNTGGDLNSLGSSELMRLKTNSGDLIIGSTTDDAVNKLQVAGPIKGTIFNCAGTQTTMSGSTSGTAIFSEEGQGSSSKTVLIKCTALLGTASYTYPTAFGSTPMLITDSTSGGLSASLVTTQTSTTVTITGATSTGWFELRGY